MEAKLIKEAGGYDLYRIDEDGKRVTFASTQDYKQKLSLKNCQAIERGYDLDELAKIEYPVCEVWNDEEALIRELAFKKGFQKALELIGDKKFSEEDVILIAEYIRVASQSTPNVRTKDLFDDYIQSLQQTEWDVEIEMQKVKDETKVIGAVKSVKGSGSKITTYKSVPKLDADGCLILKRI